MINRITAGRFKGKRICAKGDRVFIPYGRETIEITHEIVDHIRVVSEAQNRGFTSGFLRGALARCFGRTAWLSAIQSAREKSQYRVRIAYRDGTASVGVIDTGVLDQLAVLFDIL